MLILYFFENDVFLPKLFLYKFVQKTNLSYYKKREVKLMQIKDIEKVITKLTNEKNKLVQKKDELVVEIDLLDQKIDKLTKSKQSIERLQQRQQDEMNTIEEIISGKKKTQESDQKDEENASE